MAAVENLSMRSESEVVFDDRNEASELLPGRDLANPHFSPNTVIYDQEEYDRLLQ